MPVSFSGLASGMDSGAMVDQLVAAEKAPARAMQTKVANLGRQGSIVSDLSTKLRALGVLARGLDLASEVRSVKAERSDTTHVGVAVSGSATTSDHTLRVTNTARAQTVTSRTFSSDAAGALGVGSVTIATAGSNPITVAWTATDSLTAIAQRINDSGAGASAAVIYDGTSYRLVANAKATGTAAAPIFTDSGDSLGWSNPANVALSARDAAFTLDGIAITRGQNVVADVLPGVTLTLTAAHAAADPDTAISVTADHEAITGKVKGFVDAYNAVAGALDNQLRYSGTTKGADTLFGDSTLRQLQRELTGIVTSEHGGKAMSGVGAKIDATGKLTLDTAKLTAAMSADPAAIEKLFVTGGLATGLNTLTERYGRSGDGVLASKTKSIDDRTAGYRRDITRMESAADKLGERLRRQFNSLEQAISQMQNQSQRLSQLLG